MLGSCPSQEESPPAVSWGRGLWILVHFLRKILLFFFIFRERGGEGEREGEERQCVVASRAPPAGDLACSPGVCPDWELNRRPLGPQAGAQAALARTSLVVLAAPVWSHRLAEVEWASEAADLVPKPQSHSSHRGSADFLE